MGRPRNLRVDDLELSQLLDELPKGEQIHEILTELARTCGPGGALPSERVLADHWGVARQTVRTQIRRLVADGTLINRPALGVFVATDAHKPQVVGVSFTADMVGRGRDPRSVVLEQREARADDDLAAKLGMPVRTAVLRLDRLRTADGEPVGIEYAIVPLDRFPDLLTIDFAQHSLFSHLRDRWDAVPGSVSAVTRSATPSTEEAALLGITASSPCLEVESVLRDTDDVVIEVSRGVYRGDRYELDTSRTFR